MYLLAYFRPNCFVLIKCRVSISRVCTISRVLSVILSSAITESIKFWLIDATQLKSHIFTCHIKHHTPHMPIQQASTITP